MCLDYERKYCSLSGNLLLVVFFECSGQRGKYTTKSGLLMRGFRYWFRRGLLSHPLGGASRQEQDATGKSAERLLRGKVCEDCGEEDGSPANAGWSSQTWEYASDHPWNRKDFLATAVEAATLELDSRYCTEGKIQVSHGQNTRGPLLSVSGSYRLFSIGILTNGFF